ncbi:hypothetical protein [Sorangium sp. So ce1153]|uniref:hypothetical protein n=1 Tax=Sorangium sp. So ce1153 TaxID=3133333 RepID=UPI003F5FD79B
MRRGIARSARGLAALAVVASAAGPSCAELGHLEGVGEAVCPELGGPGDVLGASFSADARANAKVRTFVQAAKDMAAVSAAIEAQVADACRRMGADLGIPPAQMAPRDEAGGQASGACGAVSAAIDAILRQGAGVQVAVTPPACQANAQAGARCSGACDVQLDPGQIVAQCEPARLSGYCQGRCAGRCDGRCVGQCRGQCSAYDAQGRCVGQCNGECDGGCDATCHARCEGTWQAPQCAGMVRPPSADAECEASCRAHADVYAACTPALVQVRASPGAEMAARLAATLQANLPALLHAEVALGRRLLGDAQTVVQVGAALPRIVGDAGGRALACVAGAAEASASASVRIQVSVRASASVTGRVGATGG